MMKRITSILLALVMIITLIPMSIINADTSAFKDMNGSEYYAESATILSELGIIAGYEDGTYGAERTITRAEMAAIVCRILGKEAAAENAKGETDFDDVASEHWASGYINIATQEGIINGDGNGKFRPEDSVKYEEAIKMVVCTLGYAENVTIDPMDWAKAYIDIANDKGITDNLKGTKGEAATRGDIAVMSLNGIKSDIDAPVPSVNEGSYSTAQKVKLTTTTEDAEIYYTTNGDTPTVKSAKYTKEITISQTSTLKAITVKNELLVSDVMSVKYTIKGSGGGGGGGGGSSNSSTANTASAPILELVDDNGSLKFNLSNIKSDYTYTLMTRVNSQDFNQISSMNNLGAFEIDMPESVGSYQYKVRAKNSSNSTADSNIVTYVIALNGSGLIGVDMDNDGLSDEDEERIGTNKNNADTDGDGLLDGAEYYIVGTDPLIIDTDSNNVSDGDEDFDEDNLTNKQEVDLGTDPSKADTDNDGLNDSEEVTIHNTDPCNYDSDGDTLSDGDEILLGLNPLVQKTDGTTPDSERTFTQELSKSNISEGLLSADNDAIPTLTLTASGNINNDVVISVTSSNDFSDSRAIIGEAIDISGESVENGTLTFTLQNSGISLLSVEDTSEKFNTNLICKYNEDGSTDYLDTEYDETSNTISATINDEGTYFVLDVKNLFDELGLAMPTVADISALSDPESITLMAIAEDEADNNNNQQNDEVSLFSSDETIEDSNITVASTDAEKITVASSSTSGVMAQADIVFIIDTTGSMGSEINNVKNNVGYFVDALKEKGISAGLALIDYQDITVDGMDSTRVHKNGTSNWFYDLDAYKSAISALSLGYGGDAPECAVDALETARLLDMRASAGKIFVLVTDAGYKVDNRYEIPSMAAEIELLKNAGVNCSVVTSSSYKSVYYDLYNETDGIYANINGNFYNELMTIADRIGDEIVGDGYWIYLQGPVPVPVRLDEMPSEDGTADTDEDGILDKDELEGTIPTGEIDLDALITKVSKGVITGTGYGIVKMYKYKSNPSESDTDGDGYDDKCDASATVAYKKPVVLLHGRGDNSYNCFGVITGVHDEKNKSQNNHYHTSETENDEKPYTDVETHEIRDIPTPNGSEKTPKNLGYELRYTYKYEENKNLFAFNYPNRDMTKANAEKLAGYLENLATEMKNSDSDDWKYFYPTQEARDKKEYEIVLIGHSNGGLVSRYFIENMWGDDVVDTLITIDTPHWGSGWADVSDNLTTCYPMDIDLNPENAIFGGSYYKYSSLNPFVQKKLDYINNNQTDALNYTNHGDVKYYFIAGYDLAAFSEVPVGYIDRNLTFDLNLSDISTFGEYKTSIKNSFIGCGKYSELVENVFFNSVFDLKLSDGDNVVNNQSQLGLKFNDDKDNSPVIKMIPNNGQWMNMDTFMFHNAKFSFHSQNQHRTETISKIASILAE